MCAATQIEVVPHQMLLLLLLPPLDSYVNTCQSPLATAKSNPVLVHSASLMNVAELPADNEVPRSIFVLSTERRAYSICLPLTVLLQPFEVRQYRPSTVNNNVRHVAA